MRGNLQRTIRDNSRSGVNKAAGIGNLLLAYPDCAENKSPTETIISNCGIGKLLRKTKEGGTTTINEKTRARSRNLFSL